MSAHSASHRGGWLSALAAQVSGWVFEEVEDAVEPLERPKELKPYPVMAVVAAAPRSGATTVARLVAAEMAGRADGAAVVVTPSPPRRSAPPARAAIRLATALTGVGHAHPVGRLCLVSAGDGVVNAARYLAPVVLDLPADGSAAGVAQIADRIAVIASGLAEPALLGAVTAVVGGDAVRVANRVADEGIWADRADLRLPESRIGIRAAALGSRAVGSLGTSVAALADALEAA